jgi:hypothetical protein
MVSMAEKILYPSAEMGSKSEYPRISFFYFTTNIFRKIDISLKYNEKKFTQRNL